MTENLSTIERRDMAPTIHADSAAHKADTATQTVATKKFAMMRVAAHDKNETLNAEGQKRAFSASASIENLAKEAGATAILFVISDSSSARKTVESIKARTELGKQSLTNEHSSVIQDARLDESKSGPLLKKLKKENPIAYKAHDKLSPEAKFEAKPVAEYESGREMSNRMNQAVQEHLNGADDKTFTVFITHQNSLLNWMRGLEDQVSADWRKHHASSGEIYPMQQTNGVYSQLRNRFRPSIEDVVV